MKTIRTACRVCNLMYDPPLLSSHNCAAEIRAVNPPPRYCAAGVCENAAGRGSDYCSAHKAL